MSNTEHPTGAEAAHRSFRSTIGPVREVDLVWPPPDEDIAALSIVVLDGGSALSACIAASIPDGGSAQPACIAASEPARTEPSPTEPARIEPARTEPTLEPAGSKSATVESGRFEPRRIRPTFGDCRARPIAPPVRPRVFPMESLTLPEALALAPPVAAPEACCEAKSPTPHTRDTTVAVAEAPVFSRLPMSTATPQRDPEAASARRSAWLAIFFAAACALVTVVEYRGLASLDVDASEAPPVPPQVSVADAPVPSAQAAVQTMPQPVTPRPNRAAAVPAPATIRPIPVLTAGPAPERPPVSPPAQRLAVVAPTRDVEPAGLTPRVDVEMRDRGIVAPTVEPRPALTARAETKSAPPTPALGHAAAARPEPIAMSAASTPVVAAVPSEASNDEADIRSTLTRYRTAYSQLNASAARDVWPSVDTRALQRAFQSLKSQDLRFDTCTMTVSGARARAACKGRATYVPRIGDQSPRLTSREWNFELLKADERWTIASARSL